MVSVHNQAAKQSALMGLPLHGPIPRSFFAQDVRIPFPQHLLTFISPTTSDVNSFSPHGLPYPFTTCAAKDCTDPRPNPETQFCECHKCTHPNCNAGRHEEEAHCEKHLPCKQDGCDKHRIKKSGKLSKFCDAHHECGDHLGDENHKCKTVLPSDTGFCNEHRCVADKCVFQRDTWNKAENRYCKYRKTSSSPTALYTPLPLFPPGPILTPQRHLPTHKMHRTD